MSPRSGPLTGTVMRLSALADLTSAAELAGQPVDAYRAELAALPDGIHALGWVEGSTVLATGLEIEREVERAGRGMLVRVRARSLEAAAALVKWAEGHSRRLGAQSQAVGVMAAPGLAELLVKRAYRKLESFITMRRASGPREVPALPAGFHEQTLDECGDARYLEVGNAAFDGVPGSFPLTAADFARVRTEPGFRASLVAVVGDAEGLVGFLRGSYAPGHPGEVESLGLLPRARGRGLGRYLLHRCEALLQSAGATDIQLLVAASNAPAANLYRRHGYVEIARRDTFERTL